jgi:DNA-binding transcriptional ArsR family regulator
MPIEKTDRTNHRIQRQIYDSLVSSPGLHSREIARRLKLPYSTVKYHLKCLEEGGSIKTGKEGNYLHYYIAHDIGVQEKTALNVLSNHASRQIILFLLVHAYGSQIEISRSIQKHPTTIEFHLRKLLESGIIQVATISDGNIIREQNPKMIEYTPVGHEIIYVLRDPHFIYHLFHAYKKSLVTDDTSTLIFYFVDYMIKNGVPEKVISPKRSIDEVLEAFFEIFPYPLQV